MVMFTHYNVPSERYVYTFSGAIPVGSEYVKIAVDPTAVSADTGTVSVLVDVHSPGIAPSGGGTPICLSDMELFLAVRRCTLSSDSFANTAGDSVAGVLGGSVVSWKRKAVPQGDDGVYGVRFKWPGSGAYKFEVTLRANELERPVVVTARHSF